jgi:tetratricopeptide (TPR) repeat protein
MSADFPIVDRNHQVSTASSLLFGDAHPPTWEVSPLPGSTDYGFDYQVQLAPDHQVSYAFRVQLKGTESPNVSADGSKLSIPLQRTTLNLYANTQDEVMLVVAVVRFAANGKPDKAASKVYWVWISDELERLRGSSSALDLSTQDSVTLHVPLDQELTPELDIASYLDHRIQEDRASEDLAKLVRRVGGGVDAATGPMQWLLSVVQSRPELLVSFGGPPERDDGHRAGSPESKMSEIATLIRAGRTALAETALAALDRSAIERSSSLRADLLSLEGKVAMQRRRRDDALSLFEVAYEASPIERHLLPREELKFLRAIDSGDVNALRRIAQTLDSVQSDEGLGLLVRVHVAAGEYSSARANLDKIVSLDARVLPRLVLLSGEHKWAEVREEVSKALLRPNLPMHDKAGLQLIGARACWNEAVANVAFTDGDNELPLTGTPDMDPEAARAACAYSIACLQSLKELGWAPNVELIAPIAASSAGATGSLDLPLTLLREAAAARPEYGDLQESLELLAITAHDATTAIEANRRQGESHAVLVRRATLLFQAKEFAGCVEVALKVLASIGDSVKQTPMALAIGSAAAAKLSRPGDQERFAAALQSRPAWREFIFFAEFAQLSLSGAESAAPLTPLRAGVAALPESRLLLGNLFGNLPVDEEESAREAVGLARRLRRTALLANRDWRRLISAHLTLNQWQDAETEARAAIGRLGETAGLLSSLAIAVEMQGRTGEAVELLEHAVALSPSRVAALRNYLGLCLRLGRMQAAHSTIEKLLAVESDREERLELMRLHALLLMQEQSFDEALAVAKSVGRIVDPQVETEEGMYLNLFLAVTLTNQSIREEDRVEFWRRAAAFGTAWPKSRIFRQMRAPEQGIRSLDDLHTMLDSVLGDSRAQLREFQQRETQARLGNLPVPFVARPSFVLHYVGDVFCLWDIAKRSRPDDQQFHLVTRLADEGPATERVLRDVPLLDLAALLVLESLGLLSTLFALYQRIAVPRSTVDYISQHTRGFLVNHVAKRYASSLLAFINDNITRIDQPATDRLAVKVVGPREVLNDFVSLAKSGRWVVYTDDAFARAWVRDQSNGIVATDTLDLLRFLDDAGALTPVEVSLHLATLASWHVGIVVPARYLIASLEGAIVAGTPPTASAKLDSFHAHQPFTTLARAVWHSGKSPRDLIQHMASVACDGLRSPGTDEESMAAVWAFWFIRVKLFPSVNALGWGLLSYSLMMALENLPVGAETRAVRTMLKVVEVDAGQARMTRDLQEEMIQNLGASIGSLAKKNLTVGERLRAKVTVALASGTREGDVFSSAYYKGFAASEKSG